MLGLILGVGLHAGGQQLPLRVPGEQVRVLPEQDRRDHVGGRRRVKPVLPEACPLFLQKLYRGLGLRTHAFEHGQVAQVKVGICKQHSQRGFRRDDSVYGFAAGVAHSLR